MPGEGGLGLGTSASAVLSAALPVVPILIPLGVHFLLVCFVLLIGVDFWLPLTFLFSHLILFLVGLWASQDITVTPVIAFIVVLLMTVLLDIIQLSLYYDDADDVTTEEGYPSKHRRTWQFSAAMMYLNLLGKPVTIALACLALYARVGGGALNRLFGRVTMSTPMSTPMSTSMSTPKMSTGGNKDDSYSVIHDGNQQ